MKKLEKAVKELGKDYILDLKNINIDELVKKVKDNLGIIASIIIFSLEII